MKQRILENVLFKVQSKVKFLSISMQTSCWTYKYKKIYTFLCSSPIFNRRWTKISELKSKRPTLAILYPHLFQERNPNFCQYFFISKYYVYAHFPQSLSSPITYTDRSYSFVSHVSRLSCTQLTSTAGFRYPIDDLELS